MASPRRVEQVNILLREIIASILLKGDEIAPGVMITVTRVVSSEDLHYADVFVSLLGKDIDETAVIKALAARAG